MIAARLLPEHLGKAESPVIFSSTMSQTPPVPTEVPEPPIGHMDALPVGTRLAEFELQGLLGVGGFGMVYKAYDHSLHRTVAIKEYMPAALVGRVAGLQVSVRSTADDQPFRAGLLSFIAEARLLARFDHPSLVKVYRFWEANNTAYMVMPLYQGITLKAARSLMSGPPPEEWLRTVLWSVTQALKVLHDNGTIHRDVSPDNIFLQDVGPPVLLDLGAARRAVMDRGHKHTAILKVNYAPIEQYADATDLQEGPWTDLYALGAVVHGCVCNEAPLPATSRLVRDRMPPFSKVAETAQTHFGTTYSSPFVDAIAHTLVIEPASRTQSVMHFCEEMQLQAAADLSRFDWRSSLGDSVYLASAPAAASDAATEVVVSEHTKTQMYRPDTQVRNSDIPSVTQGSPAVTRAEAETQAVGQGSTKSHRMLWGALVLLVVASVLALVAWLRPAASPTPVSPFAQEGQTEQLPAPTVVTKPSPVVQEKSVAEKAKSSATAAAASAPASPSPITTKSSQNSEPVMSSQELMRRSNEMCAEVGLVARSMCIYRNCQKPENTNLPVCIEDRKKWESPNNAQ